MAATARRYRDALEHVIGLDGGRRDLLPTTPFVHDATRKTLWTSHSIRFL
jgi:hypothetical protein